MHSETERISHKIKLYFGTLQMAGYNHIFNLSMHICVSFNTVNLLFSCTFSIVHVHVSIPDCE